MISVKVYNQDGEESGEAQLPKVFELPWNANLVHQVVTSQAANRRPVVAHTKGRGEVRGGGRKPWRQKGTGRARHGSIRSPIWKGGGVTHGPTKEKVYKRKINRKMAQKALATVLAAKFRDHEVLVVEDFSLSTPKTAGALKALRQLSAITPFTGLIAKPQRAMVLFPETAPALKRALRNVPAVVVADCRNITALDALNRKFIITSTAGLAALARRLTR